MSDAFAFTIVSTCQQTAKSASQCHKKCSIGFEYILNDQVKNPWGDVNVSLEYQLYNNPSLAEQKKMAVGLKYQNKYGVLGSWGHIQGVVDARHPSKPIDIGAQIITGELNLLLDYNPEKIAVNKKIIAQLETQTKKLDKKRLEKKEKSRIAEKILEDSHFLLNKHIFLSHKAAFESYSFDESNPKDVELKRMLEELEEVYGS